MEKPINILVIDSYHTGRIAKCLQNYYQQRNTGAKVTCHQGECPEGVRADIFVLSARDVLENDDYVLNLKKDRGYETTKVLVVSVEDAYLTVIKRTPLLGADFTLPKWYLLGVPEWTKMSEQEVENVLDVLLTSAIASSNERKRVTTRRERLQKGK